MPKPCTECKTPVEPLDMFPGDKCLNCYAKAFDAAPLPTAEEVVAMWTDGRVLR